MVGRDLLICDLGALGTPLSMDVEGVVGGGSGGGSGASTAIGGGSGGGSGASTATGGGGTTAVGPRPRHSWD
jgi:hypothetical protein